MKHKVSQLEGPLLDVAVAVAAGMPFKWHPRESPSGTDWVTVVDHDMADEPDVHFAPSRSWCDGGPIIERELISLMHVVTKRGAEWSANFEQSFEVGEQYDLHTGPTALVAAMRAYVDSVLGDEVDLPDAI